MTTLLWQLYDEQGRPIADGGAPKLKAVMEGMLHGSAHIWVWRRVDGHVELLAQKRAASKINWPGRLDKSAGGHILYNEQPIDAAVRKAKDELGLTVAPRNLRFAGMRRWVERVPEAELVENEYQWLYLLYSKEPGLHLPTSEVESAAWRSIEDVCAENQDGQKSSLYVPYGEAYFTMVCDAVTLAAR